jgi:hypothetical protein
MGNSSERPILVSLTSHCVSMLGVAPSQRGLLLAVRPAGPASRTHQQPSYRAKVKQEPSVGEGIRYNQTEADSPLSTPNTRRSNSHLLWRLVVQGGGSGLQGRHSQRLGRKTRFPEKCGGFVALLREFCNSCTTAAEQASQSPKGRLSSYFHGSAGKTPEDHEQKVNTEEKLAPVLHRN